MTKRILIVDDSRFICDAMRWALTGEGFDVTVAHDLWELEALKVQPDLAIIDLVLQEAFGDDIAMLLRAMHGYTCPMMLMSSIPDGELEQRSKEAGLDGWIAKRLGLSGIVARVREIVGDAPTSTAMQPSRMPFVVNARQRLRRVLHIAATPDHWNSSAIISEMHALAGDADLSGAFELGDAARHIRDVVKDSDAQSMSPELKAAFDKLVAAIEGTRATGGTVLVLDDDSSTSDPVILALDGAGHIVVEARSLTEARQKMRATKYDAVVLAEALHNREPSLVPEVRAQLPDAALEIVSAALTREPQRVLKQLEAKMRPRGGT